VNGVTQTDAALVTPETEKGFHVMTGTLNLRTELMNHGGAVEILATQTQTADFTNHTFARRVRPAL